MTADEQTTPTARTQAALLRAWVVCVYVWIALVQWWPLHWRPMRDWRWSVPAMIWRGPDPASLIASLQWVLIGWLVGQASTTRGGVRRGLWLFAAALALEVVQGCVLQRHPSLSDAVLAVAAAWAGQMISRMGPAKLALLPVRAAPVMVIVLAVLGPVLVVRSQIGNVFGDWEARYPLSVGNERTSDRPWVGTLTLLAFYPSVLDDEAIGRLSLTTDVAPRREAGALVCFRGDLIRRGGMDESADVPRMDLDRRAFGVMMSWDSAPIVEPIVASGAFTVELRVATAQGSQTGPARIATISRTIGERDLTIGQEGDALAVRVRTLWNGENAADLGEFHFPGVFPLLSETHLALTCDGRTLRLYRDGVAMDEPRRLARMGWRLSTQSLPSTGWWCTIAGTVALTLPMGMLSLGRRRAVLAVTPMLAVCVVVAVGWEWRYVVIAVVAAASVAGGRLLLTRGLGARAAR